MHYIRKWCDGPFNQKYFFCVFILWWLSGGNQANANTSYTANITRVFRIANDSKLHFWKVNLSKVLCDGKFIGCRGRSHHQSRIKILAKFHWLTRTENLLENSACIFRAFIISRVAQIKRIIYVIM